MLIRIPCCEMADFQPQRFTIPAAVPLK